MLSIYSQNTINLNAMPLLERASTIVFATITGFEYKMLSKSRSVCYTEAF